MSFPTGPLRVTASQWADIAEHYDLGEEDPVICSECGEPLVGEEVEFDICNSCWEEQEKPDAHLESDFDETNGDIEPF